MSVLDFLGRIDTEDLSSLDRAKAILWWIGKSDPTVGMTAKNLADTIEQSGHPAQNASRLQQKLQGDRGVSKARDGWRLHPTTRRELSGRYAFALGPVLPVATDSVLPRELFTRTRGYLERVVEQINKSYDCELWDCCAVMCRRLIETLVIEVYEKLGRAADIKGADGNFMMLNGLISVLERDKVIHLGRNAMKALRDQKALGDQSAHNRRFNAARNDLDRIRDGLRVACEELLHLAGMR